MRAFEIFADMEAERAERLIAEISSVAPAVYAQAMALVGAAMKARPQYILKQPAAKRADMIRRVLGRVRSNDMAEEVLATYFIDARKELLVEWLDLLGLEHEEGILSTDTPAAPDDEKIAASVTTFRSAEDDSGEDRELLLKAFAAQRAINWPALEDRI
jgi:hypothetical protein